MLILALAITMLFQEVNANSHEHGNVEVRMGMQMNGIPTVEWIDAIRSRKSPAEIETIQSTEKILNDEEKKWLDLLNANVYKWLSTKKYLHIPFTDIAVPETVIILVGNQGGDDGFTFRDRTICIDVAACVQNYGSGDTKENEDRLMRLLNHEYTHLLHKAWVQKNPVSLQTPLDRALFECLYEGLGNYRSLSDKWITNDGLLTEHAQRVLNDLQPIFAERISQLKYADSTEEKILTKDLSRGPFAKKWGALCVALWLAQEAHGNDMNLREWINAGPKGIMELAKKNLPDNLKIN